MPTMATPGTEERGGLGLLFVFPSLVTVVALAFFCAAPIVPCLAVSSLEVFPVRMYPDRPTASRAIERLFYSPGGETPFIVSYTHSVNKGRVRDYCRLTKDGLIIVEKTRFVSYGAGIGEPEGAMRLISGDGYLELTGIDIVVPRIFLRVGQIAEHAIEVDGRSWLLADYFPRQSAVVIEKRRLPLLYCMHP